MVADHLRPENGRRVKTKIRAELKKSVKTKLKLDQKYQTLKEKTAKHILQPKYNKIIKKKTNTRLKITLNYIV